MNAKAEAGPVAPAQDQLVGTLDAAENGFRMVEALALAIRQFAGEAANGEGKLTQVDALQQSAALADVALWVTSEHRNSIDLYLERLAP